MVNEQEVIRKDEIDFRKIINRFLRGWPVVAIILGAFLVLGVLLLVTLPPMYNAKTALMIEKPLGPNDPAVIVSKMPNIHKIDDHFYNNQRMVFRSVPLVREALDKMGYVRYYKKGLFKRELYEYSPIRVEIDSNYTSFERFQMPYGTAFEVKIQSPRNYNITAQGAYPITKQEFDFTGDFGFGDWVMFDKFKFRVLLNDTIANPLIPRISNLTTDTYVFIIDDPDALTVEVAESLTIEPEELEASVFSVEFTGHTPQKALDFLKNLGNAFVRQGFEIKVGPLDSSIAYLNREINYLRPLLINQETEIELFKIENEVTSISREATLLLEQSVKMENDKVPFLVKDRYYNYLESYLKDNTDYSAIISPQSFGIRDEIMIKLTQDLLELQQEKNNIVALGNQSNPVYKQIEARMEANKNMILRTIDGFKKSNKIMIENVNARLAELDKSSRELPTIQRKLIELERMHKLNERVYVNLMEKKADAEITRTAVTPDFRIVEPAYLTSVEPFFPSAALVLAAALFLGLLFGFGYLLFKWVFNVTIDDESNAVRHAPSFVHLGSLHFSAIKQPRQLAEYPDSETSHQAGTLLFNARSVSNGGKVFAVGSFAEKEGKTYVAGILATKAAMLGYKTLFIDADIKNPSARDAFGVSDNTNLSAVLEGKANIDDAIQGTGIPRLDLAVLGKGVLLNDTNVARFKEILGQLAKGYDFVILDNAPLSRAGETVHMLNLSDYTIMVARRKHTTNENLVSLEHLYVKGIIQRAGMAFTDTFPLALNFNLFKRKSSYVKNKPFGLVGRIAYLFKRV